MGIFLASIDGICYIYNIRREAHLHLKGVFFSPITIHVFVLIFFFSLPPLFSLSHGRRGHLWHSMGKKPLSVLELHVEYFATLFARKRLWRCNDGEIRKGVQQRLWFAPNTIWLVDRQKESCGSAVARGNGDENEECNICDVDSTEP